MKPRHWLVVGVCAPIIALVAWLVYQQISIWTTAEPRWVVSSGGQHFGSCRSAAQLEIYDAEPAEGVQIAEVTREEAHTIINRVTARYYGLFLSPYSYGPELVWATFADGEERLTWYEVVVVDDGGVTLMGQGAVVYLNALTGEPLTLITDVVVGDPQMACGLRETTLASSWGRLLVLMLLSAYLLLLAVVIGLVYAGRYIRRLKRE